MTTEQGGSDFYQRLTADVATLAGYDNDPLMNRLLFSQVITIMEKYLYDLFIHEISTKDTALKRLENHNKFKENRLEVAFALNNSVSEWIIHTMKKMVWHRLNEIKVFYREILDISFNLEHPVLAAIDKRHDLIHRNGFDLKGNQVTVSDAELADLKTNVTRFIAKIDRKYTS